jgi:hypothetical protein
MKRALLVLATLALGLTACGLGHQENTTSAVRPADLSRRLADGMTMKQVVAATGFSPDEVQQVTCGGATGYPFTCRKWRYGIWNEYLDIYFENDHGEWRIIDWTTF